MSVSVDPGRNTKEDASPLVANKHLFRSRSAVDRWTVNPCVAGSIPASGANIGKVGEWFNPSVLKTEELQGSVSSNLTLSANIVGVGIPINPSLIAV